MMNDCCKASSDDYDYEDSLGSFEQLSALEEQGYRSVVTFKCRICLTEWRRSMGLETKQIVWERLTNNQPS